MERDPKRQDGADAPEPTEYEKFERLLKGLIAVPKSEIDAEREKVKPRRRRPRRRSS